MATKAELLAAVTCEYEKWKNEQTKYCYSTGYGGRWAESTQATTEADLRSVGSEFQSMVLSDFGPLYSVRVASSASGRSNNEKSLLVEKAGEAEPLFNFHIAVS